jgi:bifunctional UDP-N-acetylglucosamine pyrophosphorylase/glucosamine-1-phosphate N-acetyltransferase
MHMWWAEIGRMAERLSADSRLGAGVAGTARIEAGAILDESEGQISIGAGSQVCAGATIRGPVIIGEGCLVGNQAMVRGPTLIEDGVRIGFATEIKNAEIRKATLVGPMCFIADSRIDEQAYLGAQVRTSNQRLDRAPISVRDENEEVSTGRDKLGCWIGARASLGIQVIVLPGRVIAPDSVFEPRITIARNYPTGRYRAQQSVEAY